MNHPLQHRYRYSQPPDNRPARDGEQKTPSGDGWDGDMGTALQILRQQPKKGLVSSRNVQENIPEG